VIGGLRFHPSSSGDFVGRARSANGEHRVARIPTPPRRGDPATRRRSWLMPRSMRSGPPPSQRRSAAKKKKTRPGAIAAPAPEGGAPARRRCYDFAHGCTSFACLLACVACAHVPLARDCGRLARATTPTAPLPPAASFPRPSRQRTSRPTSAKRRPDFVLEDVDGHHVHLAELPWQDRRARNGFNPKCPFVNMSHTKGSLKGTARGDNIADGVAWLGIDFRRAGKSRGTPLTKSATRLKALWV